jgi:hypothetical protein
MSRNALERELLRIRPSLMALAPLDLSGAYGWRVQLELVPWRGLLLGVALLLLGMSVLPRVTTEEMILLPSLAVLVAVPLALEAPYRCDILTETAVVRQRGFFGMSRTVIPLVHIHRVEYSYPRWGKHWNVGDVLILTTGRGAILRGVRSPDRIAQKILDAKARNLGARLNTG